ncbi:MAG: hypothetical protein IPL84_00995 [Chitinophagaceae bacterium]|nr:hypothetical protein [Chitinophagaceae bacterium]
MIRLVLLLMSMSLLQPAKAQHINPAKTGNSVSTPEPVEYRTIQSGEAVLEVRRTAKPPADSIPVKPPVKKSKRVNSKGIERVIY